MVDSNEARLTSNNRLQQWGEANLLANLAKAPLALASVISTSTNDANANLKSKATKLKFPKFSNYFLQKVILLHLSFPVALSEQLMPHSCTLSCGLTRWSSTWHKEQVDVMNWTVACEGQITLWCFSSLWKHFVGVINWRKFPGKHASKLKLNKKQLHMSGESPQLKLHEGFNQKMCCWGISYHGMF